MSQRDKFINFEQLKNPDNFARLGVIKKNTVRTLRLLFCDRGRF